jgi:beta-N-acetylhexosaminidase
MTGNLDLEQLAGQLLVVGLPGPCLPAELETWLTSGGLGGVILFRRNLPDQDACLRITEAVCRLAPPDYPPFVGIDEEGGRVTRLPPPLPRLPPARVLGGMHDPPAGVRRVGEALGQLLRALGINLDFAPVLDVDTNPKNPVIGDRAFGRDPEVVAHCGVAFSDGLALADVLSCGKHFPGHGDTSLDSHLALPEVRHDQARLRQVELGPFRAAIEAQIPCLMSAHVVYSALDPGVPATLSERIGRGLLRDELGFSGVLFSDDLEMRALSDRMPIEESAIRAVRAGCDALLICHTAELVARARAALAAECRRSPTFTERCVVAVTRSLRARRRCPSRPAGHAQVDDRAQSLAALLGELGLPNEPRPRVAAGP